MPSAQESCRRRPWLYAALFLTAACVDFDFIGEFDLSSKPDPNRKCGDSGGIVSFDEPAYESDDGMLSLGGCGLSPVTCDGPLAAGSRYRMLGQHAFDTVSESRVWAVASSDVFVLTSGVSLAGCGFVLEIFAHARGEADVVFSGESGGIHRMGFEVLEADAVVIDDYHSGEHVILLARFSSGGRSLHMGGGVRWSLDRDDVLVFDDPQTPELEHATEIAGVAVIATAVGPGEVEVTVTNSLGLSTSRLITVP